MKAAPNQPPFLAFSLLSGRQFREDLSRIGAKSTLQLTNNDTINARTKQISGLPKTPLIRQRPPPTVRTRGSCPSRAWLARSCAAGVCASEGRRVWSAESVMRGHSCRDWPGAGLWMRGGKNSIVRSSMGTVSMIESRAVAHDSRRTKRDYTRVHAPLHSLLILSSSRRGGAYGSLVRGTLGVSDGTVLCTTVFLRGERRCNDRAVIFQDLTSTAGKMWPLWQNIMS